MSSRKKKKRPAGVRKPVVQPAVEETAGDETPFLDRNRLLAAAGLGVASLILYTVTLAPDILAHDVADWQQAAVTLGLSHSPAAPTYNLLGWLASLVPLGSPPARVNFLSALVGAAGVSATFLFVIMLLGRWLPALLAAVTLAVAGFWWSHAVVATPYNAIPALIAVFFILLLLWQAKGDVRLVWAGALLVGLGLGYHITLLLFLPVLLAGVVFLGPWRRLLKPKPLLMTALFLLLGLSVFAYPPLRSATDASIPWRIDSVSTFTSYVTGGEQREAGQHGFLKFPGWTHLKDRIYETVRQSYYPAYTLLVFVPALFLFYPAVWKQVKRKGRMLAFLPVAVLGQLALVAVVSGFFAQYYLPLLFYFAVWTGFSVWLIMIAAAVYLPPGWVRRAPVVLTVGFYVVVLAMGLPRSWAFADHGNDYAMREYADQVFANAPKGALVLAEAESYAGLVYAQKVEGQREDLHIEWIRDDAGESWRSHLARYDFQHPGAPVLLSLTVTEGDAPPDDDLQPLTGDVYLSNKGRTFQDREHGEPYPLSFRLYELKRQGTP